MAMNKGLTGYDPSQMGQMGRKEIYDRPLTNSFEKGISRPLSDADARLQRHPINSGMALSSRDTALSRKASSLHPSTSEPPINRGEKIAIGFLVVVAAVVRLWKIWSPTSVVFDEVHFGGFASKYIRQVFFMDVHPPLAKLLITLAAKIGGFDGNFDFKDIGKDYKEPGIDVPYVTMRMLPGILGIAIIPLAYLTLRSLGTRKTTATLGAALVIFENGLVTQSRLILLDSPLVFFTALTAFFWVRFSNVDFSGVPFGKSWWSYLLMTGLSLGAVVSCKWVGLFTIATVGLCVLRQLWLLLGNLKVTPRMWMRHFAARALCLIVVPSLFYMAMFQIHFWILNRSGDGDGFMSSEFQHTLIGHGMEDTYAAFVMLRLREDTCIHIPTLIPEAVIQQITLYPHRDDNNLWRVVNASSDAESGSSDWKSSPLHHVENGLKIRLEHTTTEKRLHSHDVRPPVSEVDFQNEVSGYGFPGFMGDANDDFVVEIAPRTRGGKDKHLARKRLRTLRSHFRLRHAMTGCYLFSHKVKLPEWGFEQQEVTCNKNPTWDNSLWYVETNTHDKLGLEDEKVNYQKPGFMDKFLELQAVMWRTNAGLTDRHAYDSRPNHWPWLRRGINFWVKEHRQIYLIGNPVIWWSSSLAITAYLLFRGFLILRNQRGYRDLRNPILRTYDETCGFLALAWALHYLPFFLMQRQLFLHHYFPALYFAILCFSATFDIVTKHVKYTKRIQAALIFFLLVLYAFDHFSPLAYGSAWTKQQCEASKYLRTWDFSCGDFYDHLEDYGAKADGLVNGPSSKAESTVVSQAVEPVPNVFEEIRDKQASEEKTSEAVLEQLPAQAVYTSHLAQALLETPDTEINQDTRAPVGKDAGAAEHTGAEAAVRRGGWEGGVEDQGGLRAQREEATTPAQVLEIPTMDLDGDDEELIDKALAEAEEAGV